MVYSDILKQANLHANLTLDTSVGLWYINDALSLLATDYPSARKRSAVTITAEADTWADLPAGTIRIVECRVDGQDYSDYEASLGQIRFQDAVTAQLQVLLPPNKQIQDNAPDIHEMYHQPLALYMAARERQRVFADEESDAARLMGEFQRAVQRVDAALTNLKGTRRTMRVGAFR